MLANLGIPSFLLKLRMLVEDSETNGNISWSEDGKSFIIKNTSEFTESVLPIYFRHKNLSSFIRQLNLYGFHKVTANNSGSLRTASDLMQFLHPCFLQNDRSQLVHIKRKLTAAPRAAAPASKALENVISEIEVLKNQNQKLETNLNQIQSENKLLFDGYNNLRHKLRTQVEVTDKLFKFLMRITMQNNRMNKRKRQTFNIGPSGMSDEADNQFCTQFQVNSRAIEGPTIHELRETNNDDTYLNQVTLRYDTTDNEGMPISSKPIITTIDSQTQLPLNTDRVISEDLPGKHEDPNRLIFPYHGTSVVRSPGGNLLANDRINSYTSSNSEMFDKVMSDDSPPILPNTQLPPDNKNLIYKSFDEKISEKDVLVNKYGGKTGVRLTRVPANSLSTTRNPTTFSTSASLQPYQGIIHEDKLLSSGSSMPMVSNLPLSSDNNLPDKFNDINSHLEHLSSSLNSWEDLFSTGDMEIGGEQLSSLLSIFTEDLNKDILPPITKPTGNELSLFTPSLMDSPVSGDERRKKLPKLDIKTAQKDEDNNSVLNTPSVSFQEQY